MPSALGRKLLRDLLALKGQVATISLVVACGIASFVALRGNHASLLGTRATFYEEQRFADVFASLERAPLSLAPRLESLPGVARVQTRIVEPAMVPLATISEPLRARIVSLPEPGEETSNAVRLRLGRHPEPGSDREAVLLDTFARAHGIRPGDRLPAVMNGTRRELRIVGTASSPEYVMAVAAGSIAPDPERFAVIWMDTAAVAAAFRMEGAFNDVSIALQPGASERAVIEQVDRVLAPYGGVGAHGRARQLSHQALDGELSQLEAMSTLLPSIFLAVAALLVNLVLSRLVMLQKPEIATLKALGYGNWRIAVHFLELVLVVCALGSVLGLAAGQWIGAALTRLYARFFELPGLRFRLDGMAALLAVGISWATAVAGAFASMRRVVRMPPAEAMRPPAPARYVRSLLDRLHLSGIAGPGVQMVVRELERRPLRTLLSSAAIAAATGLSVVGGWYYDGIEALLETQFHEVMREDAAVSFIEPREERALRELDHLPGVLAAEGARVVPVRFRALHRHRDGAVWGYPADIQMRRLRDRHGRPAPLPPDGIVLTDKLAEVLGVGVGDSIELDVQEGRRQRIRIVVTGLIDEAIGLQGHMTSESLHRALGEEAKVSVAFLRIDPVAGSGLDQRLKDLPHVADSTRRSKLLQRFRDQSASMILTAASIISLFAATITVGVVYNNARVALATRSRDLASLRVLGFTRREISSILLGELGVQVLVALPFGLLFGRWLVFTLAAAVDPETYRLPVILTPASYAFAALVTLGAAVASALLVRRRLDHLDLIGVLKTRE